MAQQALRETALKSLASVSDVDVKSWLDDEAPPPAARAVLEAACSLLGLELPSYFGSRTAPERAIRALNPLLFSDWRATVHACEDALVHSSTLPAAQVERLRKAMAQPEFPSVETARNLGRQEPAAAAATACALAR